MDREELKEYIIGLGLDVDIETVLLGEVEHAEVIDQAFLDRINKLISLQADLYENTAETLEGMQEDEEEYQEELQIIDEEEELELAEIDLAADEKYMALLEKHVKDLEAKDNQQPTPQAQTTPQEIPQTQTNTMPPVAETTTTAHPSAAVLNRPIMPPGISHLQTGPDLSTIPLTVPNLNPNPVE